LVQELIDFLQSFLQSLIAVLKDYTDRSQSFGGLNIARSQAIKLLWQM